MAGSRVADRVKTRRRLGSRVAKRKYHDRVPAPAVDPHRLLADAYIQLGREESASREVSEAERIQANGGSILGTPPDDHPEDHR